MFKKGGLTMFLENWKENRKKKKLEVIKKILYMWNDVMPKKIQNEKLDKWALIFCNYSVRKLKKAIRCSLEWQTRNESVEYLNLPVIWTWID